MPLALDQFSQRLAEVGLLHESELTTLIDALPADRRPTDGEQLARLLVKRKKLTVYQAQQIYAGKGKSLVLGNYVVLEKLGQGGMGTVLKAEHRRMERIVAIKVLSPSFIKNPGAVQRFQREVKMAARLEHPNIVTAYDADEAAGVHFLVMQYVDGVDLGKLLLQTGPLPIDQAVSFTIQAAQGLDYAHRRGVIHRDVKPSNLLLDRDGVVKVLDMGLARIDTGSDEHDQLTLAGQIMGTVDYMAPEQAFDTRTADARADIYSLGATLWHLLTGRTMYQADTIMQKLRAHERAPIPSLAEYCPDVPRELETVFCTMVAKLPEQRFQTMSEVVSQLEHCLAMLPPTPRFDGSHQGRHHAHGSQASTLSNPSPVLGTVSAPPATHPPLQQGDICLPREGDTEPHTNRAETSPNLVISPRSPAGPRLRRRGRNYYLALGGGIAALLAGIVVLIPTKDGTIRVEIGDPQIEVNVKGTDIVLGKADSTHDIALSPGEKTLIVKRGDFVFETDDFTLKKGETAAVRVQLLDGQVEVHQGDQLLGKEKLPLPQPPAEPAEVENAAATESPPLTIAMAPFNATQAKRHQQAWAEHLGIPVEQAIKLAEGVELPLVLIPPGEFLMGSTDEQIEAALRLARKPQESSGIVDSVRDAQRPQHRVRLTRPFLIGATEVTIGQFKAFSKATGHVTLAEAHRAAAEARRDPRLPFVFRTYVDPGFPVTDDHPASQVTWEDANAFCDWLNHQAAKQLGNDLTITFRLPTEAEWEYACRAGTDTLYSFGDNARHLDQYGWYDCKGSLPVATRRPNAFGLYDMHGNVSEWCNDWFDPIWYEVSPTVDPVGPEIGKQRVLRGGSWWACRQVANISAMRRGLPARYTYNISWWGFRVAATLSPRSVEMQSGQVPRPPQENAKLAQVSEDQQAFIDRVARLPAEQQAAAVAEKLQEVNPGFDGVVTHRIADGKVVEYGLSTARVRNIWPLSALTDLEALEITGFRGDTQVGWVIDLEPLAGLPLQSLNCSHNRELRDLTPLKGMQLTTLSILGTSVTDLSPLAGMPLTRLECGYTNITDLRPLQGMPLSELVCMHTPISDLSPLGGMELRHLNIAGCRKITDFSQLTDLSVSILAISNTAIADLSPLRKMPLTRLFCDDTPVADLSPLKDIPLHTLSITGTAVTDLSPIKDIPLTQLNFDIVPERDVELLRAMKPLSVINMRPAKEFWQSIEPARPR